MLRGYPHARELVWAQEEPQNMGAWTYAAPKLRALAGSAYQGGYVPLTYVGRPERASPAEGHKTDHDANQAKIVADELTPAPSRRTQQAGAGAAR